MSGDNYKEPWSVTLHVNKTPVCFKIDTGADISVMSESTYQALPQRPQLKPSTALSSSPGGKLNLSHEEDIPTGHIRNQGTLHEQPFESTRSMRNGFGEAS